MNTKRCGLWMLILIVMSAWNTTIMPALVTAQESHLIQYDQVVIGEITNDTPEIHYTFEGDAGDIIIVSMSNSETGDFRLNCYLELLDPDGQLLYTDDDWRWIWASPFTSLIGPVSLSETGTYTVITSRSMWQEGDSNGRFELIVKRVEVAPLTVNETTTVEINSDMPTVFTYTGGSTDVYRLVGDKLEGIGGFYIEVRDPHGIVANQNFGGHQGKTVLDALSMREVGHYLIVVKREVFYSQQGQPEPATDVLRLTLTLQSVETQAIALDTPVSGTLSYENPSVYYTFTGSQGDWLRLTGSLPADNPPFSVLVVPPYGLAFIEPGTNREQNSFVLDPLVLDTSGDYVLLVRRYEGTAEGLVPEEGEIGATEFTITLGTSQIPILEPGIETIGTVAGESNQQIYRYDSVAGQTLRITLHSTEENFWPLMLIESPAEVDLGRTPLMSVYSTLPITITFEVTLPITGVYTFRVENIYSGSEDLISGQFSLLVEIVE